MRRWSINSRIAMRLLFGATLALWFLSAVSDTWLRFARPAQHNLGYGHDEWSVSIGGGVVAIQAGGIECIDGQSREWLEAASDSLLGHPLGWQFIWHVSSSIRFGPLGIRTWSGDSNYYGVKPRVWSHSREVDVPVWMIAFAGSVPLQISWIRRRLSRLGESRIGRCPNSAARSPQEKQNDRGVQPL